VRAIAMAAAAAMLARAAFAQAPAEGALPARAELQLLSDVVRLVHRDFARATDDALLASGCADALASATGAADRAARTFDALPELVVRARAASAGRQDDRQLVRICIDGIVSLLDRHSKFLDEAEYRALYRPSTGFAAIGVALRKDGAQVEVADVYDGAPAAKAGLRVGDRLLRIDGADAGALSLAEAADRLRGAVGSRVALQVARAGAKPRDKPADFDIVREVVRVSPVQVRRGDGGIVSVRFVQFSDQARAELHRELAKLSAGEAAELRGIVIDLRDNSGGLLRAAIEVSGVFLPEGANVGSMHGRRGRLLETYTAGDRPRGYLSLPVALPEATAAALRRAPLAVLVNGRTASGAEILAAAIQANRRGVLVGTDTLGMGSIQTLFPLGGTPPTALKLTTGYWLGPKDAELEGQPLKPDLYADGDGAEAAARRWIAAGGNLP